MKTNYFVVVVVVDYDLSGACERECLSSSC